MMHIHRCPCHHSPEPILLQGQHFQHQALIPSHLTDKPEAAQAHCTLAIDDVMTYVQVSDLCTESRGKFLGLITLDHMHASVSGL